MRVKNHNTRPRPLLLKYTMGMSPSVKRDVSHINLVMQQLGMIILAATALTENVCHGRKNSTLHHYFPLHCTTTALQ